MVKCIHGNIQLYLQKQKIEIRVIKFFILIFFWYFQFISNLNIKDLNNLNNQHLIN